MATKEVGDEFKGGISPTLLVKTCDGRVKFSDTSTKSLGTGGSKSWTVANFDTETDMIEFEAVSTDGWQVEKMELQVCDDNGNNCRDQPVKEDYNGTLDAGNAFWVDLDCGRPSGLDQVGCDDTYKCNCYKEKFYIKQVGDDWIMDDNTSTCDVRSGQMTVMCNNSADDTVEMTAAVRKDQVHGKPSAEFTDTGDGYWQAIYTAAQLAPSKSFESNVEFQGVAAADYLVLSKTVDLPCKNIRVDGVDVCQKVGSGLTWTCRYSLADQTKTDAYTVTGQDTQATADGIGTLNYVLEVLADKSIGEQVQFEIRPVNEGLVTADIKHCEVAESADAGAAKVSIIGDDTDATKDKCYVSSINSGLTEHTGTGTLSGYWNAFKWSTSDNTDAENQQLSCSIALSQNGNNQPAGANC